MENNSIVKDKSYAFAILIVKTYQSIIDTRKEFVLSKQLLKSGTSIGANIHEATQGFSRKDFIFKMQISLKEAYETSYWLRLLTETKYIAQEDFETTNSSCIEIIKILTAIIKTAKANESMGS